MAQAQPLTVGSLLDQHSVNAVHETRYISDSRKAWARHYPPATTFTLHSYATQDRRIAARFEPALEPLCADDDIRMQSPAYPPNSRSWRLDTEADATNWFHHEVSNVVLPAFSQYPAILQVAEAKPLSSDKIDEVVDVLYSAGSGGQRQTALIVEMKRGLIDWDYWTRGKGAVETQRRLSQELRGYAFKYSCPQIMCFDGYHLLMLQFRAHDKASIDNASCPIDCWIIPRENDGGCSLRLAFYRFLVQGLRRCQGLRRVDKLSLDHIRPSSFAFFSGRHMWNIKGNKHPEDPPTGWTRYIHTSSGAFYYSHNANVGHAVWETEAFWDLSDEDMHGHGLTNEDMRGPGLTDEDLYD